MPSASSFRKALIFAGIATVVARPQPLVVRRPIASGSYVPVAVSAPAPSAPAASAPAPSSPPSQAPYIPSFTALPASAPASSSPPSEASVIPSYTAPPAAPSTPPSTPTTTSTTAPPPVATWHIDLEVGSSTFNIGDADSTTFEGLWANVCGADGCDGGSPQTYNYNGASAGIESKMSGTFTMTGNVDNNQIITNDLLDAINAALQASKQCSSPTVEQCMNGKRDPETPGVALDCSWDPLNQCTMANYIQATIYDDTSSQKGQITMSAASEPDAFDCNSFVTAMNGAATGLDLDPPIQGATVLASLICLAVGSS